MIDELNKKNLPIKVYQQDTCKLNTGKKYDAIFSHGTAPMTILRDNDVYFDTYVVDKNNFFTAIKRSYNHLKEGGFFLCGVQIGARDSTTIGDFYRSESSVEDDILIKTHFFKDGDEWISQTVTARMWKEKDYINLMRKIGFRVIGLNESKTWFIFKK